MSTPNSREMLVLRDEYLTSEQVQHIKEILETQLKTLLANSREAMGDLTEDQTIDPDTLDIAVNASNRDFTLRMADRERKMLGKIRHSLARIPEEELGVCESCGAPITYERLLARPVATLCIDCKTEAEHREGSRRVF